MAVIGSTTFWHGESADSCAEMGELLAGIDNLILLTGGVPGVGESVGRGYLRGCSELGRTANVIHVLPRGCGSWDYGSTLFAGDGMDERREILGRLAKAFIVVEGGPGTEHEATVASSHGAVLVPVGRSGSHAGTLYRRMVRPPYVDTRDWKTLGNPEAVPRTVAAAVVGIIGACVRHGV